MALNAFAHSSRSGSDATGPEQGTGPARPGTVDDSLTRPATASEPAPSTTTFRASVESSSTRVFRFYRGSKRPRFVNDSERECAEILDYYGVPWEYEPITFVLETDDDGRVTEAFSPDFYLPEQNLFLEVTTMRQELVTRKNRKMRKLRQRYPDVNIKLFYRRDIEALGQKLRSRRQMPVPAMAVGAHVHSDRRDG